MILDKTKPLIEYLNYVVMDGNNNQAHITRSWSGNLIKVGHERGEDIYKYENIVYGDVYFAPITDEFNEEDELLILYKALTA